MLNGTEQSLAVSGEFVAGATPTPNPQLIPSDTEQTVNVGDDWSGDSDFLQLGSQSGVLVQQSRQAVDFAKAPRLLLT
jgi:hypothetical protein